MNSTQTTAYVDAKYRLKTESDTETEGKRNLVRREIRNDCRKYEEEKTSEIIEETWSTHKLRKEMQTNRNIIQSLTDKLGNKITNRKKLLIEITDYYRNLYNKNEQTKTVTKT